MNPQFNFTNPQLATREILFVGFDRQFSAHILHYPFENDAYSAFQTQDPLQAFSWLNERVDSLETYQLPFAVFFHLDWLERNRFRLIQHLKMHPDLSNVPFIALSESDKIVKIAELLQHGIDDCYQIPVAWDRLEQRLEFLNQYKSALLERSANFKPEAFGLRQAPGKRLFDILAASFGLMMTAPVWLLIAAAIKLESKGPIFYKSKRAGMGYKVFDFIKFRSMYSDAERRLNELKNRNQYDGNSEAVFIKLSEDPRVTKVGKFIRKYSLDELPQLLNILRGDMSLVGNRPLPLYEAVQLTREEWCARFLAPAGLTGLWQVTKRGKSEMSTEERIALDIEYSKNYNVWSDMVIIFKTFSAFIQHENV
jgi:lipopolysaccharide/colanic/teichoic acid biosynthesis glycosyltransferase